MEIKFLKVANINNMLGGGIIDSINIPQKQEPLNADISPVNDPGNIKRYMQQLLSGASTPELDEANVGDEDRFLESIIGKKKEMLELSPEKTQQLDEQDQFINSIITDNNKEQVAQNESNLPQKNNIIDFLKKNKGLTSLIGGLGALGLGSTFVGNDNTDSNNMLNALLGAGVVGTGALGLNSLMKKKKVK